MIKDAAKKRMQEAAAAVEQIDVADVDADRLDEWLVLDVREDHEYAAGHLPGALSLPRSRLEMEATQNDALEAGADTPTLVYCGSGKRSLLAAEILKALGVTRPVSMAGGFGAWHKADKPVSQE
ncbi:MAG: rhodanese-like domain-containing protein [Salinisphaera sp.]|jgi:rhodanese-related sulfurtransferase|nr:rhodanese-like domain-containing protein [Salinisphaera sp.]